MKPEIKLLDCTLRDGGYCTNWNFNKKMVSEIISSLNRAGVDIIEIGYKSPKNYRSKEFQGLFKYCDENLLQFIKDCGDSEYAFMIDAKGFLIDNIPDENSLETTMVPAEDSLFDYIRIATYYPTFNGSLHLAKIFRDLGYKVTLNLMGWSLLEENEIFTAINSIKNTKLDCFYFSDSFGDLLPSDIIKSISTIKQFYNGNIGLHTHDNNGLAFANTITAIDYGIDFIDSTIMGMGRGAGNLKTEQQLLYMNIKLQQSKRNPSELLDLINKHFLDMHSNYRWGSDYTYMLSAMQNIHPTYCMMLKATNQYTIEQVNNILNSIHPSEREKFSEDILLRAIEKEVNKPQKFTEPIVHLDEYEPKLHETVLIIATGPGSTEYKDELKEFIERYDPFVIECNPRDQFFENCSDKYIASVLNWVRLENLLKKRISQQGPIVTGISNLPEKYLNGATYFNIPCHVAKDTIAFEKDGITIPSYVIGMYAVGLAVLSNPKTIYLAGYDGYQDNNDPQHIDMNRFWEKLKLNIEIVSLTPTKYPVPIKSIYQCLR